MIKRFSVTTAGTAPTYNVKLAIQTALVRPDKPGAWQTIGTSVAGAGESAMGLIDVSQITAGQAWVRFGIVYYLGGTTPKYGQADVELTLSYQSCGQPVGSVTQELQAFNTESNSYVAVTGWLRTLLISKVIAFFMLAGVANGFRCRLCYRVASTSTQAPGSWVLLESGYRSTDDETSTGELPLTFGTEMYVQFGIAYSQSTAGAAPGQATVGVSVATRR